MSVSKPRNLRREEAHRALELLEEYHASIEEIQLKLAVERLIRIFKSRLFQVSSAFSLALSLTLDPYSHFFYLLVGTHRRSRILPSNLTG